MSIVRPERAAHVQDAVPHRFFIGQIVRLKGRTGVWLKTDDVFHITATLPPRDDLLQYRIRNDNERHERVATEYDLELVDAPPVAASPAPALSSGWTGTGEDKKPSDRDRRGRKPERVLAKAQDS